jgi:hypothetical protein
VSGRSARAARGLFVAQAGGAERTASSSAEKIGFARKQAGSMRNSVHRQNISRGGLRGCPGVSPALRPPPVGVSEHAGGKNRRGGPPTKPPLLNRLSPAPSTELPRGEQFLQSGVPAPCVVKLSPGHGPDRTRRPAHGVSSASRLRGDQPWRGWAFPEGCGHLREPRTLRLRGRGVKGGVACSQ